MTNSEAHATPVFKAKAEKVHSGVTTSSAGKFYIAALKNRVHIGFAITGLDKCARGRC
jgi:hypothetical protein